MVSGRSTVLTIARAIRPARPDVFITLAMTAAVIGMTAGFAHWHDGPVHLDTLGVLWLLACTAPLLYRCRAPLIVLELTSLATFTYYASGYPGGPAILAPTLALVTVAYVRGPLIASAAGAVLVAVCVTQVLLGGDPNGTLDPRLLGFVLWVAVAICIGTFGRMRRAAVESANERAAEANRLRAEEQRLSIAREVHDVVAHSLAMINVQAGVAAHVADRRPDEAKAALLAIKEASRSALTDLRATLGVLRSGDERAPTPGLGRLPDLVTVAGAAGITVRAEGEADVIGTLPAPVDVAAYRILQECLTNVVRHGKDADTVTVRMTRTDDELAITVRDNGRAAKPPAGGGNGLRGMAERAEALGGRVVAGPAASGGFQVSAWLPLAGGGR
ncbi:MAG TPA: sensor histidine kinase [Pseudonocardiaceae bacterium]|nr:sensor histidine kinase [Pseudonocardiaceae bacterium]